MTARKLLIIMAAGLALFLAPAALAAPTNDNLAGAAQLSGANGFVEGSNVGATKEVGEPAHAGEPGGRSVWYTWTAPEDGTYVFDTFASSFDTLLAVYTGSDLAALVHVAGNDDAIPFGAPQSQVAFQVEEGTTFAIAIDGFAGKAGQIGLGWRTGRPNDLFAHPHVLSGAVGRTSSTNVRATMESGEPRPFSSAASVWYEWTAPATGRVKFSTFGTGLDTVVGVYTGTAVDALTMVASNDDDPALRCCTSSFVGFEAVAGIVYRIAVGGWSGEQGNFILSWSPLILGTAGADTIVGTPGVEEIRSGGGNDVLSGLGGADVLVGGSGNDRSFGGSGNDVLIDRHGRDVLAGGTGADRLDAFDFRGRDVMNGGSGRDSCSGDRGDTRRRCP
jgi:Ca2+-binding RTX toxin-like protein